MLGAFPPNSRETFFKSSEEFLIICFPTFVDPVKEILLIKGFSTMAAPATSPNPGQTFMTPFGTPASSHNFAISSVPSGVNSEGLITIEHPAASAGAIFQEASNRGKFHGRI